MTAPCESHPLYLTDVSSWEGRSVRRNIGMCTRQIFPGLPFLNIQFWLKNHRLHRLKNHRLSSNTPRTPTVLLIQQSCVIITFSLLSDLCAWVNVKKSIVKESIVLQWAVRIASCDFKPGKKRWAGALLSVKCCCFVRKPSWKRTFWPSGDFLVQYFRDAF